MTDLMAERGRPAVGPPDAEARLRRLVFEFYGRVRRDDLLGPVFEERLAGRWETHLERMCDFWSTVLYATGRFRGNPIHAHARIPGLSPAHFQRWIQLFEETALELLPSEEARDIVTRSRRMRTVLERNLPADHRGAP